MNLGEKKLFLLDMDGTLYLGKKLFPGTMGFLEAVRARGGRAVYATNNSSRSVQAYVDRMAGFGIRTAADDFMTSVNALTVYLKTAYPDALVYALGTETFRSQLADAGIRVTTEVSDDVTVLAVGFDTELTYKKLEDACRLLRNERLAYVAANPDWVCPLDWGSVPDCGSICEMLWHASGRRPKFIGKPEPEMALLALKRYGFTKEETLLVGDRIYTDIACGVNAGIDTCFVLSGEGVPEDIEKYGVKPTLILRDIGELTQLLTTSK